MEAGLKVADAPVGRPLMLSATVPENPLIGEISTVTEPPPPRGTCTWGGVTEIAKLGGLGWTTSVAEVVRVRHPLLPVPEIESGKVPLTVFVWVETQRVEELPVAGFGLKYIEALYGPPLTLKFTGATEPSPGEMERV